MRKLLGLTLLSLIALALSAQTAYTPPVLPPLFSATDLGNSAQLMTDVNTSVATYTNLLLKHDADLYSPTGSVAKAIAAIPAPTPPAPPVDVMLVIPYGSTGYSITTLGALAEYPPAQRTRRKLDFTNVHQTRSCANVISPGGTGSNFAVQVSSDPSFATPLWLGTFDVSQTYLTCTNWTPYTGAGGDQFVRVVVAGTGTVTLDFVSLQLR